MRNSLRYILVAIAAIAIVSFAFACQGDKAKMAGAAGCDHAKAADAGGCPHAKAEAMAASHKEPGCAHEKADAAQAAGCHGSKATDAQKAALAKGEAVTLTGQVMCASCDLKMAKGCQSMFKASDGTLYALIGDDAAEKLTAETRHGEKTVEVTGTAAKDGDQTILQLQGYKVVS